MLKAVLFDIDGTLVSLEGGIVSTQKALAKLGLPVPDREFLKKNTFGYKADEYLPKLFPGKRIDVEEFRRLKDEILFKEHLARAFDYTKNVLTKIKEKSLKIGVITTNFRKRGLFIMEDNDLPFDALVGVDEVENRKPAPDAVLKACRKLGVMPEESIMVGDDVFDVWAGKAAGVSMAIGVTTGKCTREELSKEADKVVDSLEEILRFLDGSS